IRQFRLEGSPAPIEAACFGVAGPVIDGRCTAVNLPWEVDEASLAAAVSTPRVKLVNDLEATGHGVLGLPASALATLQPGEPRKATMALIAAGAGRGGGQIVWGRRRDRGGLCQGGHAGVARRAER